MRAAFLGVVVLIQSISASFTQAQTTTARDVLAADTPRTTVEGNTFIAPAGWRIEVRGPATILEPPEGNRTSRWSTCMRRTPTARLLPRGPPIVPMRNGRSRSRTTFPTRTAGPTSAGTPIRRLRTRSAMSSRTAPRGRHVDRRPLRHGPGGREKRGGQVALIFSRYCPKATSARRSPGRPHTRSTRSGLPSCLDSWRPGARNSASPASRWASFKTARSCSPAVSACASSASGAGRRKHAVHGRVQHEGAHDADAREARRGGQLTWETPVPPDSDVQARERGDDRELVKHLVCACTGPRRTTTGTIPNPGHHAETARRARDLRADEQAR